MISWTLLALLLTVPTFDVVEAVDSDGSDSSDAMDSSDENDNMCPKVYHKGTLALNWNPAFLHVDEYSDGEGLTISSFFNVARNPSPIGPPVFPFERDLVARIPNLDNLDIANFDVNLDLEELTDTSLPPGQQPEIVWPNESVRAPSNMFHGIVDAVVIPQGFLSTQRPGRLTAVDITTGTEYIIHQSTLQVGVPPTFPIPDPENSPRFYHRALFIDIDGDNALDIVTVRSGFLPGQVVHPPKGELVWFKNPGTALDPNIPWEETVLFGGIQVDFLGPDIHLASYDFENDGVPEIIATHFFSAFAPMGPPGPGSPPIQNGKITIYGTPQGQDWSQVDQFSTLRQKDISVDQGFPFEIEIVDLNRDGKVDILATNHQPDQCSQTTSNPTLGKVYAYEQPTSGNIFDETEDWILHVLLDDIKPQPSLLPARPPGRLAPGAAQSFYPLRAMEKQNGNGANNHRPWIVVGGDEAGKVWILEPTNNQKASWEYKVSVIFDINDFYGENATQTPLDDPFGITISTIGAIAVRYDRSGNAGRAELYIPVFEAKDIHVFSFRTPTGGGGIFEHQIYCTEDTTLACPSSS